MSTRKYLEITPHLVYLVTTCTLRPVTCVTVLCPWLGITLGDLPYTLEGKRRGYGWGSSPMPGPSHLGKGKGRIRSVGGHLRRIRARAVMSRPRPLVLNQGIEICTTGAERWGGADPHPTVRGYSSNF